MIEQKLKAIVEREKSLHINDPAIEECWKEQTAIMLDDMVATKDFIAKRCSDEMLYWISAVFDDIAAETQDKEFISIICERTANMTDEEQRNSVMIDVEFAERNIADD